MSEYPFSLSKKSGSPFYYVRFKNLSTGKYLAGRSTKQTTKNEARAAAWKMYRDAMTAPAESPVSLETKSFRQNVRKADISNEDLEFIVAEKDVSFDAKNSMIRAGKDSKHARDVHRLEKRGNPRPAPQGGMAWCVLS